MDPSNYRARLLRDIATDYGIPILLWHFVLSNICYPKGLLSLPTYILFVLLWLTSKSSLVEWARKRRAHSLYARSIPQVKGKWPGNVDVLLKMMRAFKTAYVLDVYRQLFEEYQCTTLNLRILWRDNIISMDKEHMKFVQATGFPNFWRGKAQKERMELFFGEGIFNRDDEVWKMHRSTARPFFARERIEDFETFERHCAHTLSIMSRFAASGTPCEAQDLYSRFSLDTASEFLFGKNLETLSGMLPSAASAAVGPKGSAMTDPYGSFVYAFETAQLNITNRGRLGSIWPLFELTKDKNEEHRRVIHAWLDPLVRLALDNKAAMLKAGVSSLTNEKNFMQHLADSTDDPILIRDQLLSMLLASRDTTACTLTYITYFLAIHPDVLDRLRTEVLDTCGLTGTPTFSQLRGMKYMRAVINETLRLFPPVPLNVRETRASACLLPPGDGTFTGGVVREDTAEALQRPLYMPANTTITYLPLLTQRNPSLWGADADVFDPERWLDPKRIARYVANPTMYTPFGAGPRICLGQNYAYNEMSYFLIRLLQQFDGFTLASDVQPVESLPPAEWKNRKGRQAFERIWPAAALTLFVKGGLWRQTDKIIDGQNHHIRMPCVYESQSP